MEKESDTRAHQLLAQRAILSSIDLGALIIEVFILNKRAELGRKKVIGTGKRIERQVCVTSPTASVDRNVTSYRVPDLNTREMQRKNRRLPATNTAGTFDFQARIAK